MKPLILTTFLFFAFHAQGQYTEFYSGENDFDYFQQVVKSPDDNLFILGTRRISKSHVWLQKVSTRGVLIWEKVYPLIDTSTYEVAHQMKVINGEVLIVGERNDGDKFPDFQEGIVLKTDLDGNLLWRKEYPKLLSIFSLAEIDDNYLIAGESRDNWRDSTSYFFINNEGEFLRTPPIEFMPIVKSILPLPNQQFYLANRHRYGVVLTKINAVGDTIWTTLTNENSTSDFFESSIYPHVNLSLGAVSEQNGKVTMVSHYSGIYASFVFYQFSERGKLIFRKTFDSERYEFHPFALEKAKNGDWLIAGTASSRGDQRSSFLMRLNEDGEEIWRKFYHLDAHLDIIFSIEELDDGTINLAGTSNRITGKGYQGWFLSVDSLGNDRAWEVKGKVVADLNGNCQIDSNEPLLENWVISSNDPYNTFAHTNLDGKFEFKPNSNFVKLFPLNRDSNIWELCKKDTAVIFTDSSPIKEVTFLVKQKENLCLPLQVSMTQTDFQKCERSKFLIDLYNESFQRKEKPKLEVRLDSFLTVVSSTHTYTQNGNVLLFDVPTIESLSHFKIEIEVELSCGPLIGLSHSVFAKVLNDPCVPVWSGHDYYVTGWCDGNENHFIINQNNGGSTSTNYKLYSNADLIADSVNISISPNDPFHLKIPSNGRTWRLEVQQPQGYEEQKAIGIIEACGKKKNGLYSFGYKNMLPLQSPNRHTDYFSQPNTTGIPSRFFGAHELGGYFQGTDLEPYEYTIYLTNPFDEVVTHAEIILSPALINTPAIEILASNVPVEISYENEEDFLQLDMRGLNIEKGEAIMIKYREQRHLALNLIAKLNDREIPITRNRLNNHLSIVERHQSLPDTFQRYGGRFSDYYYNSIREGKNGDFFGAANSRSFSFGTRSEPVVYKMDSTGKVKWRNIISTNTGDYRAVDLQTTDDGGCILLGAISPDSLIFASRLDSLGNIMWTKRYRPLDSTYLPFVEGISQEINQKYILYGRARGRLNGDPFYMQIDSSGNMLWLEFNEVTNQVFAPTHPIRLPDGSMIFGGEDLAFGGVWGFEKISPDGESQWYRVPQNTDRKIYYASTKSLEDEIVMIGSNGDDIFFSRYDFEINTLFDVEIEVNSLFGSNFRFSEITAVNAFPDSTFMVLAYGFIQEPPYLIPIVAIRLSKQGEVLGFKMIDLDGHAHGSCLNDSGIVNIWATERGQTFGRASENAFIQIPLSSFDTPVSVEEIDLSFEKVKLYPNPANSILQVSLPEEISLPSNWIISDYTGKTISKGVASTKEFQIDLNRISSGLYFFSFPEQVTGSKKIIIQK